MPCCTFVSIVFKLFICAPLTCKTYSLQHINLLTHRCIPIGTRNPLPDQRTFHNIFEQVSFDQKLSGHSKQTRKLSFTEMRPLKSILLSNTTRLLFQCFDFIQVVVPPSCHLSGQTSASRYKPQRMPRQHPMPVMPAALVRITKLPAKTVGCSLSLVSRRQQNLAWQNPCQATNGEGQDAITHMCNTQHQTHVRTDGIALLEIRHRRPRDGSPLLLALSSEQQWCHANASAQAAAQAHHRGVSLAVFLCDGVECAPSRADCPVGWVHQARRVKRSPVHAVIDLIFAPAVHPSQDSSKSEKGIVGLFGAAKNAWHTAATAAQQNLAAHCVRHTACNTTRAVRLVVKQPHR